MSLTLTSRTHHTPPILTLAALLVLLGCHKDTPPEPPDVVLHDHLRLLAGPKATDCGRATTDPENVEQTACAMDAITANHSFFVQYRLGGATDSTEQGLALSPAGVLTEASTLSLSSAAAASGRIDSRTCSRGNLHTSILGYLAC